MQPHPPRPWRYLGLAIAPVPSFFFFLVVGMNLPYIFYLASTQPDHIGSFFAFYASFFTMRAILLSSLFLFGLFSWRAFGAYRRRRQEWSLYQDRLARGEATIQIPIKDPVTVAGPDVARTSEPITIRYPRFSVLTLLGVGIWTYIALFLYFAWAQHFFRWPPNVALDHAIWGTTAGVWFIGNLIILFRARSAVISADELGITTQDGRREQRFLWSEVRQVVLMPLTAKGEKATEEYIIVTTDDVLQLSAATGLQRTTQRTATRALVALTLRQTRLPLLVERESLAQRDTLLAAHQSIQVAYLLLAVGLLIFSALITRSSFNALPYHQVTGALAHYATRQNSVTITLMGDATVYDMSTVSIDPQPPDALPLGAPVTMQVDGQDVGQLDVQTTSQTWHIVTQDYAEPWSRWLTGLIPCGIFYLPGFALLGISGNYFLRGKRDATADIFPPPQPPTLGQRRTAGELQASIRQKGRWWGVDPKEIRDVAIGTVVLGISLEPLAIILLLSLIAGGPVADGIWAAALGVAGPVVGVVGVALLRHWRAVLRQNQQGLQNITGTVVSYAPYLGLFSNFGETAVQVIDADGHEYIFRVRRRFSASVREAGGRVQIVYQPATGYVQAVTHLP